MLTTLASYVAVAVMVSGLSPGMTNGSSLTAAVGATRELDPSASANLVRWSALDPYQSLPVGRWILFAGRGPDAARAITQAPADQGRRIERDLGRYDNFSLTRGTEDREMPGGALHLRTYVESDKDQEIRLWAGADERFQVWLNGGMIRDGWGWNYFEDDGTPWTGPDGTRYDPPSQHLFFEVPQAAVASAWIAAPQENSGSLNNDLDFNWKSMAWLRLKDRAKRKDVVLVRFDIAEPLLRLLKTQGQPAHESIVGWLLVKHKLAYVTLVDLNPDRPPQKAVDLLTQQPE